MKALPKKLKFTIKDFFSKCDQIGRKLQETYSETFGRFEKYF